MSCLGKNTTSLITDSRLPQNIVPGLADPTGLPGDIPMHSSRSHGCKVLWCTAGAFPDGQGDGCFSKGKGLGQQRVHPPLSGTQNIFSRGKYKNH